MTTKDLFKWRQMFHENVPSFVFQKRRPSTFLFKLKFLLLEQTLNERSKWKIKNCFKNLLTLVIRNQLYF
jgi:hypothetical protein